MNIDHFQMLAVVLEHPALILFNVVYFIINIVGLTFFVDWLLHRHGLTRSLIDSKERPNGLNFVVVFYIFGLWLFVPWMVQLFFQQPFCQEFVESAFPSIPAKYIIGLLASLLVSAICVFVAKINFQDGLKGFGIDFRTIKADFKAAAVNLLCVVPLISICIIALSVLGKLFWGSEFELPRNNLISEIMANKAWSFRILLVVQAVLVAPVLEELLFRGFFQNILRKSFGSPYLPILFTSVFFAMVHGITLLWHWPALFILSCCMGYAYEKSSSLLRNIFVHAMFNSIAIISTFMHITFK